MKKHLLWILFCIPPVYGKQFFYNTAKKPILSQTQQKYFTHNSYNDPNDLRYYEYGDPKISEITIDEKPIGQQIDDINKNNRLLRNTNNTPEQIFNNLMSCFRNQIMSDLIEGGNAIGLCEGLRNRFAVTTPFGYGAMMKKSKTPLMLTQALEDLCTKESSNLIASFIPI